LTVGRIWKSVPVRHPSSWSRSHWKCLDREPYRRQHERPLFWPTISALGRTRSLSDAGLRLAQCFAVMTSRFRVRTALKTTSLLPLCYPGRKEKRLAFLQAVELFGCGDPQTNPSAQGQDCASAAPGGPRSRTRRSTWVGAFLWRLLSPCNPAAELRIKSPHSANWRHSAATQKLLDSSHPPMGILWFPMGPDSVMWKLNDLRRFPVARSICPSHSFVTPKDSRWQVGHNRAYGLNLDGVGNLDRNGTAHSK